MREHLVDEFRVAAHPVVLGSGKLLFPQGGVPAALRLTGTETAGSGVVRMTYGPAND